MSRRPGHGGRPRHGDHRGGPRPNDPSRAAARPAVSGAPPADIATGAGPVESLRELPLRESLRQAPAREQLRDPVREVPVETIRREERPVAVDLRPFTPDPPEAAVEAAPLPAVDVRRLERPDERGSGCTTAQLRRFIKSRAYVPMHEIRRRFAITADDDDVTGIVLGPGKIFVGLPPREAMMLGDLFRAGEVGYELQLDPIAPVVVGVYPMRPVTRS